MCYLRPSEILCLIFSAWDMEEKSIIHYLNYNTLNRVALAYILNTKSAIVSNKY